jgi:predicted DCC family thiol-disulfide oxidoreductase YuxK
MLLLLRMLTRLSRLLPLLLMLLLLLLLLRPLLLPGHSAVLTATRSLPPTIREATLQALLPQFLKRLAYSLHAQLRGTIPQPVLAVHCAFICDYTSLGIKDRIKVVLIEDGVSDAGFCEQELTGERRF